MSTTAIVVLVGPGPTEAARAERVIKSALEVGDGNISDVVIVNDDNERRETLFQDIHQVPTAVIQNPRHNYRQDSSPMLAKDHGTLAKSGGLTCGALAGFRWILTHSPSDLVLKLDTDAIVIGKFSSRLREVFGADSTIGMIGTVGRQFNPGDSCDQDVLSSSPLLTLSRLTGSCGTAALNARLRLLKPFIDRSITHGYANCRFCLGGAYAVSREMLQRLSDSGGLTDELLSAWSGVPLGEDISMGMLAYACGLTVRDCSGPGDLFAISWKGIGKSPIALYAQNAAFIHSVKNDDIRTEAEIVDECHTFIEEERRALHSGIVTASEKMPIFGYSHRSQAAVLGMSNPKVLVVGEYLGQPRFGPLVQTAGVFDDYQQKTNFQRIVAVDAGEVFENHTNLRAEWLQNIAPFIFSNRPLPTSVLDSAQLTEVREIRDVVVIHLCGTMFNNIKHLGRLLRVAEALIDWLAPAHYIMSSVRCDGAAVRELVDHIQRTHPSLIGTQDSLSLEALRSEGIPAQWSCDDALPIFSRLAAQTENHCEQSHVNTAIECSYPPSFFWESGTYNSARALSSIRHIASDLAKLRIGSHASMIPVVVNSSLEEGAGRSVWSCIAKLRLSYESPVVTAIDAVSLTESGKLTTLCDVLKSSGVGRVVASDLQFAVLSSMLGYPTYILPYFGSYSDRARHITGQISYDIEEFIRQDGDRWRRWTVDQIHAWFIARNEWDRQVFSLIDQQATCRPKRNPV